MPAIAFRHLRFLLALILTLLPVGTPAQTRLDTALARFEDPAALPPLLAALPYAPGRAYALLVMLPAPAPVSLADPASVRRGLVAFLNPVATWRAGTEVGHAMVGWRCADGRLGLAGKTSDDPDLGLALLRAGWGVGALLSEYRFGRVHGVTDLYPDHARAIAAGRASVAAFEISATECQAMRAALARYLVHPAAPATRYTNLPDPAAMQGDGCASFALWLAGQGGVFRPLGPVLQRQVVLRDSYAGLGAGPVPAGVIPYRPPGATLPVGLRALILGDWRQGREVGRLTLLDPELMLAALDRALARARIDRPDRLGASDPAAAGVRAAADRWLARYPRATPVRMGRARAVVLHRS